MTAFLNEIEHQIRQQVHQDAEDVNARYSPGEFASLEDFKAQQFAKWLWQQFIESSD